MTLCKELGIEFDLDKHCAYNNEDVKKCILELPPRNPIICDEAVRFAMAQDWASGENKQLMSFFAQIRTKKLCIFFNIPKMKWIYGKYGAMATWWLKVYGRGVAVLFRPDLSEAEDPFHIKELQEKERAFFLTSHLDSVLQRVSSHPCFVDVIRFPPLPHDLEQKYLKLRNKRVFEDELQQEKIGTTSRDIAKRILFNIRKNGRAMAEKISKEYPEHKHKKFKDLLPYSVVIELCGKDPVHPDLFMFNDTQLSDWYKDVQDAVEFMRDKDVKVVLPE